jgi:hypothetical protein
MWHIVNDREYPRYLTMFLLLSVREPANCQASLMLPSSAALTSKARGPCSCFHMLDHIVCSALMHVILHATTVELCCC